MRICTARQSQMSFLVGSNHHATMGEFDVEFSVCVTLSRFYPIMVLTQPASGDYVDSILDSMLN